MFSLNGKVALITGASGGIGGAIAKALHGQGATVVLSGTREAPLLELAALLGERAHVVTANLAEPAEADRLITAAEAAAGPIDILVNNAGMWKDNLAVRMKDAEWQAVIDVNLTAPVPPRARGDARDAAPARGADHQYQLAVRHDRQPRPGQLRRRQGRHGRDGEIHGL